MSAFSGDRRALGYKLAFGMPHLTMRLLAFVAFTERPIEARSDTKGYSLANLNNHGEASAWMDTLNLQPFPTRDSTFNVGKAELKMIKLTGVARDVRRSQSSG